MKETMRQTIQRLAADNQALREMNSVLSTDISFLRSKLDEADNRARRLIASNNRGNSARRAQMEIARNAAMKSGVTTKASFDHA